jgi:DUF1009 family protein
MSGLAMIAGTGRLPAALAAVLPRAPRVLALAGFVPEGVAAESFRLEHLGSVLARLRADGIDEVVFAGAVRRPSVDPAQVDAATAPLLAPIVEGMRQGDDSALRAVIGAFEAAGLRVRGAAEIAPALVVDAGALAGTAADRDRADAARGRAILDALARLDVGQACVTSGGLCLGIEALPGTAALLDFVARTRTGRGGVLVKRPKAGQDLRIDMPVIGPDTVAQAAAAGLSGIALQAGGVLLLDRAEALAAAAGAGIAIWGEP